MNSIPRRLIIILLHLVVQYGLSRFPIWPILRANISHFTAQYHPYCTPIWPILQRCFYVTANQLLRNPFSKVLPQAHAPLPLGGLGWVCGRPEWVLERVLGGGFIFLFYSPLTISLNILPRSSMLWNRSKLAQQGLRSTVSPGCAISLQARTQSSMLCVSRTGSPKLSKLSCSFWLSAPR